MRCEIFMKHILLVFYLFSVPSLGMASTGGMGDVIAGYFSIYVLIPVLGLLPTARLIYLHIKRSISRKIANIAITIYLIKLLILFFMATQYFSFNFHPPYKKEAWELLYFLVIPPYLFFFLVKKKDMPDREE